jgi:phage terminase large subunit
LSAIRIPNNWEPREYQLPTLQALDGGKTRAVVIWHRRAGKDSLSLNYTAKKAFERVGVYWHMLPTATQARKVVWDGIDREGRRIIDQVWPKELRSATNKNEMKIELANGSIWQVVGSDNYDSLVGANPVGVVFSEYSLADPAAWNYIRPILAENGGWAIFIYTPRGKNHGYDIYKVAKDNPDWYCELLTVSDTSVLSSADIQSERRSGMSEAMIQQEYYCSFESALEGAYYGALMDEARQDGRITKVPYDPAAEVITVWDLGIGDSTSIWFAQRIGREVHAIDYYENSGEGFAHYAKVLKQKPYDYGKHYAPHDIQVRELGSGKSRLEVAQSHGIRFEIVPKLSVEDGIEAARTLIPRMWFDEHGCERGIECLKSYRKQFNDKMQTWSSTPVHDWASHGADAFRYLAIAIDKQYGAWKPLKYPSLGIV